MQTHPEQWAASNAAPGEQLGVWCLAQGSHLSRGQFLPEPRFEPTTSVTSPILYPLEPRLPNIQYVHIFVIHTENKTSFTHIGTYIWENTSYILGNGHFCNILKYILHILYVQVYDILYMFYICEIHT